MNLVKKLFLASMLMIGFGQANASENPAIELARGALDTAQAVWDTKTGKVLYAAAAVVALIKASYTAEKTYNKIGRFWVTKVSVTPKMKKLLRDQATGRERGADLLCEKHQEGRKEIVQQESDELDTLIKALKNFEKSILEQWKKRYQRLDDFDLRNQGKLTEDAAFVAGVIDAIENPTGLQRNESDNELDLDEILS